MVTSNPAQSLISFVVRRFLPRSAKSKNYMTLVINFVIISTNETFQGQEASANWGEERQGRWHCDARDKSGTGRGDVAGDDQSRLSSRSSCSRSGSAGIASREWTCARRRCSSASAIFP